MCIRTHAFVSWTNDTNLFLFSCFWGFLSFLICDKNLSSSFPQNTNLVSEGLFCSAIVWCPSSGLHAYLSNFLYVVLLIRGLVSSIFDQPWTLWHLGPHTALGDLAWIADCLKFWQQLLPMSGLRWFVPTWGHFTFTAGHITRSDDHSPMFRLQLLAVNNALPLWVILHWLAVLY